MSDTNKYNLPESFAEDFEHFYIPKHLKNIGVMADVHIPYQSNRGIEEAIDYFLVKNIDCLFINGDALDCYMLSSFQPDPRKRHFAEEVLSIQHFFRSMKEAFPGARVYYKKGNHEFRYERIMMNRCPEFLSIPAFEFSNVLGLKDLGIEVIDDKRIVYAGNLPIFHGHELNLKSVSVNPARSLFLKTHASAMCSHLHRTSQHTEPSINEDIVCWSTGHLGEEHPAYAPINKWNLGCARIEKDEEGNFEVINFGLKKNKLFSMAVV